MTNLKFLPGQFHLTPGNWRDYRTLARFHYLPRNPATWSEIWAIRYEAPLGPRLVAVGVVSFPAPTCHARRAVLGLRGSRRAELKFANRNIRTISRVIVHPQFRTLGLSSRLVRWICKHCKTRYVEALAVMGRVHPFSSARNAEGRAKRSRSAGLFHF